LGLNSNEGNKKKEQKKNVGVHEKSSRKLKKSKETKNINRCNDNETAELSVLKDHQPRV